MVRVTGLEPAQPSDQENLNLSRLPIPPYPHIKFLTSKFYTARAAEAELNFFQIKSYFRLYPLQILIIHISSKKSMI